MGNKRIERLTPLGVILDQPPFAVGPESYTNGTNVTFREGLANRAGGFKSVWQAGAAFPFTPLNLLYAPQEGVGYWAAMGASGVFVTDGETHSVVTPAGGLTPVDGNDWSACELNGLAVFNNSVNPPFYWNGNTAEACQTLPGWPIDTTCYVIRPYKFHLVAMNINGPGGLDDTYLLWSDAAAPGQVPTTWTPATGSEAGDNVLGDTTGAIVDALQLRDDLIIYKQHSCYMMSYVGGSIIMAFRKLFSNVGALNRNCVAEHRGYHYVLSDGDIVRHDGQAVESIIDNRNRQTVFQLIDNDNFQSAFVAVNAPKEEIWFFLPTNETLPNVVAIYHTDSNTWAFREIPRSSGAENGIVTLGQEAPAVLTWETLAGSWAQQTWKWNEGALTIGTVNDGLLFCDVDAGKVQFIDADVTADGVSISARLEKLSMDFGTPDINKIVRRVTPRLVAPEGSVINISVGGQPTLSSDPTFYTAPFIVKTDRDFNCAVTGRYLSFRFETTEDFIWQLAGFDVEYEERGRF